MLQVSFFCQIGEGIIFVSGERSPTIIFFWGGGFSINCLSTSKLGGKLTR